MMLLPAGWSWDFWFWWSYQCVALFLLCRFISVRGWQWDYWLGHSKSGPVVMLVKKVARIPFTRWQLHLHKMIDADRGECFHTHPAYAVRIVLWGGYVEQVLPDDFTGMACFAPHKTWRPGMIGLVRPELCHRVAGLRKRGRSSWSLWLRGPCEHAIDLRGAGWKTCSRCCRRDVLSDPPYESTVCDKCITDELKTCTRYFPTTR